ncbi:MAG: SAM-dependent methyltransferase [Gammaproteobacteria bacterium]
MSAPASLPDPDPAGLERSRRLAALIRADIDAAPGAVIGFEQFMQRALYEPGLGYYAAGNPIFGAAGDFVTAPESGDLFAACLARQCREILAGDGEVIVEYGAGSGQLAAALCAALGNEFATLRYHIIEPSATLRERQRERLAATVPAMRERVTWSDQPVACGTGVVIANEVLDALPAARMRNGEGGPEVLGVGLAGEDFTWRAPGPAAASPPAGFSAALAALPPGCVSEYLPGLDAWCRGLREVLERGVVLVGDYGYARHEYVHPARPDGTLKCHYRHHVHDDPFFLPGLQDITVAVDFTHLAEAASAAGLHVAGYVTQARFLLGCGLEEVMLAAAGGSAAADYARAQEAKRLLLPGEMGETCKFMALTIDYDRALRGFVADERHRLDGYAR